MAKIVEEKIRKSDQDEQIGIFLTLASHVYHLFNLACEASVNTQNFLLSIEV